MTKLYELIKINLLGFSGLNKTIHSKDRKEKTKAKLNMVLLGSVGLLFGYYIYMFASSMIKIFLAMNKPEYLLVIFMLLCTSYLLIVNIYKGPQTIFKFKDYDLLLSLPITKKAIIISKLATLYLYNMVFQVIILIPVLIVYLEHVKTTELFYLLYFLSFILIPIIPIVIATLLGTLINYSASKFKYRSLINILGSIVLVGIMLFLNYKLTIIKMDDLVLGQVNIIDRLKYFYPIIYLYLKCMADLSIISFCLMLLLTAGVLGMFLLIINRYHDIINQAITGERKNEFLTVKVKQRSVFNTLYGRELKKYFSSPVYVLNTAIGLIMLVGLVLALVLFGLQPIEKYLKIPDLNSVIQQGLPFIITLFCTMSCTTHCAISLEGKNFWIIRSLPISFRQVIGAKIMLNISLCIPVIIICGTILNLVLDLSLAIRFLLYITPIVAVVLISYVGIILDLLFLKLDWDNEVIIIKQRIPALVAILIGILIGLIPLVLDYPIKNWLYILAITIIYLLLTIIMIYLLRKISQKRLTELN